MDRFLDEARHLECCESRGEALSRAKEKPLESSPEEDPELSSGNGTSNSEVQAGQFGRRRHVGVRIHMPTLRARPLTVDKVRERWCLWLRCLWFGFLGRRNAFQTRYRCLCHSTPRMLFNADHFCRRLLTILVDTVRESSYNCGS